MKDRKMISIIIPAYNEQGRLGPTLQALTFTWILEIIVVNDGSTDQTRDEALSYPVRVVDLHPNQGKGRAVREGIRASRGEIILLLDADLGESVREAEKLILPLLEERAEAAVAVLPVTGGGLGLVRWLADRVLKGLTGSGMKAPLSGQRCFSRQALEALLPLQQGFGLEIGMDIKMLRRGITFEEVPCAFKHRVTGFDLQGFCHRGSQFLAILSVYCKMRLRGLD